ncbi:MAG TPA: response regulator [Phototrophicaceae bacterium]|nr:response regulator [Phototrophicaceae bacterium]
MTTILYVEDHPPARLLMQAIVSDLLPHNLVWASTGAAARVQAVAYQPGLYIVDLDLPDTDGLTLARALRELHPAPVILVSAYAEAVKPEQFAGIVQAYLAKPLDPEYVAEVILHTLAGRK